MIGFRGVTIREAVKRTVWARNTQLTVSGYSPLEIATGRRPPDLLDIETSDPAQLSVDPLPEDRTQQELQRLALKAHQEARQAADLRHEASALPQPVHVDGVTLRTGWRALSSTIVALPQQAWQRQAREEEVNTYIVTTYRKYGKQKLSQCSHLEDLDQFGDSKHDEWGSRSHRPEV